MELYVSRGVKDAISFDMECMLVMAYIRLGHSPVRVIRASVGDVSDIHSLPLLVHDSIKSYGAQDILTYLRKENYGIEYGLSELETVQMAALIAVIENRLNPGVRAFLWAEDNVFSDFTRHWYTAPVKNFFHASYLLYRWRQEAVKKLKHCHLSFSLHPKSESQLKRELYKMAERCLTSLSYILGKKTYFLDDNKPTAVDAYIFANMWPLLLYESQHGGGGFDLEAYVAINAPETATIAAGGGAVTKASQPLVTHLLQCPNLMIHFHRILRSHFPGEVSLFCQQGRLSSSRSAEEESQRPHLVRRLWSHPARDSVLVGVGIFSLFLSYAYSSGLVRISLAPA